MEQTFKVVCENGAINADAIQSLVAEYLRRIGDYGRVSVVELSRNIPQLKTLRG